MYFLLKPVELQKYKRWFWFGVIATFLCLFSHLTYAAQRYHPISASQIPEESRSKLASAVAKVLGVKDVALSDIHYGSGAKGFYACAFFSYDGNRLPFAAEFYKQSSKWRIVRNPNKKALLNRGPGTSYYYAVHYACSLNGIALGRWNKLIKSSSPKVGGGNLKLTSKQRRAIELGLSKRLGDLKLYKGSKVVKLLSYASKKHKKTVLDVCGYMRVGREVVPYHGFLASKKNHFYPTFPKSYKGEAVDIYTVTNSCVKAGFTMQSAL
nr:hypothetical protein [uncultured Cohaesibacter sp.]